MKHQKKGRKFGRVKKQRESLLNILLGSLILHERIKTTEAKAKEIKGEMDILINRAKKGKSTSGKTSVIRHLKSKISSVAADKLQGDFLEKFSERTSGYTRVVKLSPRQSDGAKIAIIEFV